MRRLLIPLLVILIGAATVWQRQSPPGLPGQEPGERVDLPAEALTTLELIERGGPFPYRKDGSVFGNREGRLPDAARGYYHEYTVPTPGSPDRGARRIVTGGAPPAFWYYTEDHYRSFRPINPVERSPR
jgi:ribonuclease T1